MRTGERRTITIVDFEHKQTLQEFFRVHQGAGYSFHLKGKQWRFENDHPWRSDIVVLQEVIGEEADARPVGDEQAILRGQWDD